MKNFTYQKPSNLQELIEIKNREKENALLYAGGTNLMVYIKDGKYQDGVLVPVMHIDDLKGFQFSEDALELGACETMETLMHHPDIVQKMPFIPDALSKFANPLVRTMSTIGGNIADGSPIADTAPMLLTLESKVVAVSGNGERTIAIDDFFDLPGKTTLKPDEVIRTIRIPVPRSGTGKFIKLGLRKGTSCAVTSAGVWLEERDREIKNIRIGLGGVAPRPVRARNAEAAFTGAVLKERKDIAEIAKAAGEDMSPITDVRATAEYRRDVTINLVTKAVAACLGV
jgi:CO/xanthine dehydrogenase FAD-binding subunit